MNAVPQLAVLVGDALQSAFAARSVVSVSLKDVAGAPQTADLPGDVVLIDIACPGAQALLEAFALRRPDAAMVLLGNDLSADAVRSLFRFAASDVVTGASGVDEILSALEGVSQRRNSVPATPTASTGAVCWAVNGAVGGAGVTTLAIELAFAVMRKAPAKRVALIDLNLTDGMTAAYLDGQKKLDVAGLCASPERIDETLLRAYAWEHPKGIFLVAAPRNPRIEDHANEAGVLQLLDVACTTFDHVIVDLPRHRTAWHDAVLSAADEVLVISELTVPSLHAAADLCRDIDQLREGQTARMVLNRMFAKRSHRNSFPIEKAEQAIHREIDFSIRSDWDSARMAVNLGVPIAQVKSRSPLVQDVDDLLDGLWSAGLVQMKGAA